MSVESDLCTNCGLCCNGTLFRSVSVTAQERRALGHESTFFEDEDGGLHMRQPCCHLSANGACTIYNDRPETCRTYACLLLERLRAGKLSPRQTRAILKDLDRLFADLRDTCQQIMPQIQWPEKLVSRTRMADLVKQAESLGAEPSLYEWLKIELKRQAIVTFLRLHFRLSFQSAAPKPAGGSAAADADGTRAS